MGLVRLHRLVYQTESAEAEPPRRPAASPGWMDVTALFVDDSASVVEFAQRVY